MKKLILLTTIGLITACGDSEPQAPKKVEKKAEVKKEEPKAKAPAPQPEPKPEAAPEAEAKAEGEPKADAEAEAPKEAPAGDADAATVTVNADGVAELTIEAKDSMQYNAKKFTVKAGQKVKLTLKHVGVMPKAAMGHNLVILKPEVEASAFAALAASAFQEEYFPAANADQTIAHTKLIGGGESTTIEFEAPAAGSYTFICTYPGHWGAMRGEMIVEAAG